MDVWVPSISERTALSSLGSPPFSSICQWPLGFLYSGLLWTMLLHTDICSLHISSSLGNIPRTGIARPPWWFRFCSEIQYCSPSNYTLSRSHEHRRSSFSHPDKYFISGSFLKIWFLSVLLTDANIWVSGTLSLWFWFIQWYVITPVLVENFTSLTQARVILKEGAIFVPVRLASKQVGNFLN